MDGMGWVAGEVHVREGGSGWLVGMGFGSVLREREGRITDVAVSGKSRRRRRRRRKLVEGREGLDGWMTKAGERCGEWSMKI